MKAEAKSLRFLGEGKKLTVPFFQRHYVWIEDNWKELLSSFESAEDIPFLGSIILKNASSVSVSEAKIIDGQQRLTTITILAKAIYDCLSEESKQHGSGIRNSVENFLFYRRNSSDDFADSHIKIQHSRVDNEDYSHVVGSQMLNGPIVDLDKIDSSSSNILKCYKYYRDVLADYDDSRLKDLFNSIFDDNRKLFVLIELEYKDINEQVIFDTINRAGVRLSTAEIIKNNIFKLCFDKCEDVGKTRDDVYKLYDEKWDSLFFANAQDREIWDSDRIFGNAKRTNLEFILYCVATIKWRKSDNIFSKLDKVYSAELEYLSYGELEALIIDINTYAKLFKEKILDLKIALSDSETAPSFKHIDTVDHLLLVLEKLSVQMFYPYVLERLRSANGNDQDPGLKHDFSVLESFVIRRRLSGRGVTDYATKCSQLLHEADIASILVRELISPDSGMNSRDIKERIKKISNDDAKIILFCIELFLRKDPRFDLPSIPYYFTLEHIIPIKWTKYWSEVPIYNEDGTLSEGSDQEKTEIRDAAVHNLGNMILLNSKLNASLGNNIFEHKIEGIGDTKPGYRKCSTMELTKEIIAAYDADDKTWDELHIYNRANSLWESIIKIWPDYAEELPLEPMEADRDESESGIVIMHDIGSFSAEALSDPIKMLDEMKHLSSSDANPLGAEDFLQYELEDAPAPVSMISQAEFVRRVNIQSETVARYVREGKIVPDSTSQPDGGRKYNYFTEETLSKYIAEFGWEAITESNLKPLFLEMVQCMTMSYSYKPVLLKAILAHANSDGMLELTALVDYFRSYYNTRKASGLFVEKSNSIFSREAYSDADAKQTILTYPYTRFAEMNILRYMKATMTIEVNPILWDQLTDVEKEHITTVCDEKLDLYYSRENNV